jgi:transcriptional regulator with XRE-family HTH domain
MSRSAAVTSTLPKPVAEELRTVGLALRAARVARNETQEKLARRLGVALGTVKAAERGNPRVGSGVLFAMIWALGLAPVGDEMLANAGKAALTTAKVRARRSTRRALDDF